MKTNTAAFILALMGLTTARPVAPGIKRLQARAFTKLRREVPQEHSHEQFLTGVGLALNLNNVDNVQDPVFALLGNAAAAAGAGNVENLDCLQQRVADQAFTNAKEAGDIEGMTNALIYRTLERNTGSVGLASVLCTETAQNPEIDALQQHQDPASEGAAALNKEIVLELAVQLNSIGADPQLALLSGTFEPGDVNDATGAGNTCNELDDPVGCIETLNLRVDDATADEIDEAVAAAAGAGAGAGADAGADDTADEDDACATTPTPTTGNTGNNAGDAADQDTGSDSNDVNAFTGTLGSAPIPIISSAAERPFEVNGSTFLNLGAAAQRACDVQKNACANAANGGDASIGGVAACDAQQQECIAANA